MNEIIGSSCILPSFPLIQMKNEGESDKEWINWFIVYSSFFPLIQMKNQGERNKERNKYYSFGALICSSIM